MELGLSVANWVITLIVSVQTVELSITQEPFDNSRLGFLNAEPLNLCKSNALKLKKKGMENEYDHPKSD